MNNTSQVLGSALHIACAENVPNRMDILRLLLENGANPNIVAKSEEGLLLLPVMGEYISSNRDFSLDAITLLLRHGAKVTAHNFNSILDFWIQFHSLSITTVRR